METKQTAVEWLKYQLEQYGSPSSLNVDWETLDQLIEQTKEMEKEQMFYSFEVGYDKGHNSTDWVNNVPKMRALYEDCKKKGHII